ncbi:XF1762 family protein [Frankia sp. R43]|uniref:XF1762 family protein n=1 Tax=Frankia sp. R43 TaxID=269536 RepID=UPI00190FCA91|nr:XF1762 family protein [Frankia sp. R43]
MHQPRLRIVPITRDTALAYIKAWHRHHAPPVGYRFALGVAADDVLVGVATAGRPVARSLDDGWTLEVTRTSTNGTPNANSALYGAAWRAARALGYLRCITYTQAGESGASLRGAGWLMVAELAARKGWDTPSRRRRSHGNDGVARARWEIKAELEALSLRPPGHSKPPDSSEDEVDGQVDLFGDLREAS